MEQGNATDQAVPAVRLDRGVLASSGMATMAAPAVVDPAPQSVTRGRTMLLVCEGECNPNHEALDSWRSKERIRMEDCRDGKLVPLNGAVVDAMRGMRHTPHRRIRVNVYACEVCGTRRIFGDERY